MLSAVMTVMRTAGQLLSPPTVFPIAASLISDVSKRDPYSARESHRQPAEVFPPLSIRRDETRVGCIACGQKTQPNHNSFPLHELRHARNRLLSRSRPLTLVGPGNMVKLFRLIAEHTVSFILQPWQFLLMTLASWVHREQQKVIDFYQAELKAVMKAQGKKRLLLTDEQRRLLAVKGKSLGRKTLMELTTIVTPDTILRWHRQLVAQKWDYSDRRTTRAGRPPVPEDMTALVLQMARENPSWGYDRIQGALANLGHTISDQTVGNILKAQGIEPAPERKRQTTWKMFLKSHWDVLGAIDFTTIEVWTKGGLVTFYLLFVMELKTRRVHFAGCTPNPDERWMTQVGRNLTDAEDGFFNGKRYVLMDRDGKFCGAFRVILEQEGVNCVRLSPRSPNLTPHIERFMKSVKEECLLKMIFFGEKMLRTAIGEFLEHYHCERNHQGLGNQLIEPGEEVGRSEGAVQCRERIGGLLRYYHREAA